MNWQKNREPMSGDEYFAAIHSLGMSIAASGRFIGRSERTAHRYCKGTTKVPLEVALLLRNLIATKTKPIVPPWKGVKELRERMRSEIEGGNKQP